MAIEQCRDIPEKSSEFTCRDFLRIRKVREDRLAIAKMIRLVIDADDPKAKAEEIVADLSRSIPEGDVRNRAFARAASQQSTPQQSMDPYIYAPLADQDADWLRKEIRKWS
jgi:hypothetical protein